MSNEQFRHFSAHPSNAVPVQRGRNIIAVIGIDDYMHWPKLNNAVNDALGIQKLFIETLGFVAPLPPLLNRDANIDTIMALVLDGLYEILQPDDSLVLFYAGHGHTRVFKVADQEIETGYIIPAAAHGDRWSDYIKIDSFLEDAGKLPARHVLLILDSCHSGFGLGTARKTYRSTVRYEEDLTGRVSRKIITSARRDQMAVDSGPFSGHSLFTGILVEGLRSGRADLDNNGLVTSSELGLFLQAEVGQSTGSQQTPDFGSFYLDDRGEMLILIPSKVRTVLNIQLSGWQQPQGYILSMLDAEEHKGDYRKVLADSLLARGVLSVQQGDLKTASACFDEVQRLVPNDANCCLRAVSYAILTMYEQYNTFPNDSGASAIEITARWKGLPDLQALDERWQQLRQLATDADVQFEAWFVYSFLCSLKPARATLETSRYSESGIPLDQMLQIFLSTPTQLHDKAVADGQLRYAAFADLAIADLYRRVGGLADVQQSLDRAFTTSKQAGDTAGMATCLMMRGDWLCAPFSTPIAWDFALQDSNSDRSSLSNSIENKEFRHAGQPAIAEAQAAYAEAERLFHQANALRGIAAIQLRHGYLAMLGEDYATAMHLAASARDGFKTCGDWRGYWIAQTHRLMCLVAGVDLPGVDASVLARTIGRWGAERGSFSFTLGLGILLNRFARHLLLRKGNYDRALAGSWAAQALFDALGATTNAAQCLVDQALTYELVGDRVAALGTYEQALDVYTQLLTKQSALKDVALQRSVSLSNHIFRLHLADMDPDGIERIAALQKLILEQTTTVPSADTLLQIIQQLHLADIDPDEADIDPDEIEWLGALQRLIPERSATVPSADTSLQKDLNVPLLASQVQSQIEQSSVLVPLYRGVQARDAGNAQEAQRQFDLALGAARQTSAGQRDYMEAVVWAQQRRYAEAAEAFRRYLPASSDASGVIAAISDHDSLRESSWGQVELRRRQERFYEQAMLFYIRCKAYQDVKVCVDALELLAGPDWWMRNERPWETLGDYGELYEGLSDLPQALTYYQRAIEMLEAQRGLIQRDNLMMTRSARSNVQFLYFQAARTSIRLHLQADQAGDPAQVQALAASAFDYAERGKAHDLLNLMVGSALLARSPRTESKMMYAWRQLTTQLAIRQGLLTQERSQAQLDQDRISFLAEQIEQDEAQLLRIEAELAASDPTFYQAINPQAKIIALEDLSAMLPTGTALLQFSFLGEDLLAWAITRNGMVCVHHEANINTKTLNRHIQAFHRACAERSPCEPLASQLAETLLQPFKEIIRTSDHLIVVPYGVMYKLPFHALPFEGQPVCATHVISYLPSASTLQLLRRDEARSLLDRVLVVGNPTNDVPAAATEAAIVARLFQQHALIGDQATKETVLQKIADSRLLHFATHSKLSEHAPLNAAIMLAEGDELTVYELMGLQLKAELVVLSACNTAKGESASGDDVLGLTHGLFGAGARAAVVSLWPVDDVATSLFMGQFYRRLLAGDAPVVALQSAQNYLLRLTSEGIARELEQLNVELAQGATEAQRNLRQAQAMPQPIDYRHPFYWAPFVLVG